MRDLFRYSGLLYRRNRIAAANDRDRILIRGNYLGEFGRAHGESGHLEDAHWAVPYDGRGIGDLLREQGDGLRPNVESHPLSGKWPVAFEDLRLRICSELVGQHVIDRQ